VFPDVDAPAATAPSLTGLGSSISAPRRKSGRSGGGAGGAGGAAVGSAGGAGGARSDGDKLWPSVWLLPLASLQRCCCRCPRGFVPGVLRVLLFGVAVYAAVKLVEVVAMYAL
jgi:hypothetical protein